MKQERIEFFENLLSKPMAEPHRSWIEELLAAVPRIKQEDLHNTIKGVRADWTKKKGVIENVTAGGTQSVTAGQRDRRTYLPAGPVVVKPDGVTDA